MTRQENGGAQQTLLAVKQRSVQLRPELDHPTGIDASKSNGTAVRLMPNCAAKCVLLPPPAPLTSSSLKDGLAQIAPNIRATALDKWLAMRLSKACVVTHKSLEEKDVTSCFHSLKWSVAELLKPPPAPQGKTWSKPYWHVTSAQNLQMFLQKQLPLGQKPGTATEVEARTKKTDAPKPNEIDVVVDPSLALQYKVAQKVDGLKFPILCASIVKGNGVRPSSNTNYKLLATASMHEIWVRNAVDRSGKELYKSGPVFTAKKGLLGKSVS